jgi:hypothetical protein
MTSNQNSPINFETSNPKYNQIKEEFDAEIKKHFNCDNYDEIVNFVFDLVFIKKTPKNECISSLQKVFSGKTEDIVNFLWNLVDKINKGEDLLVDLIRSDSQKQKDKEKRKDSYTSKRKETTSSQDNANKNRKGNRDYRNNNRDRYNRKGRNKFDNSDSYGNERMKIGNKEVIIHGSRNNNKHRERDRSRSNDSDINNHNNNYHMQKHNGKYYQQFQRGVYPPPPMNMRFNPYYQQYPYGNYTYGR